MADTNFTDKSTVIQSDWAQEINDFFWTLFQGATTSQAARTALGITNPAIIQENTTARQLVASDSGTYIVTTSASPVTITVPSGVFTSPTTLTITQLGSGQVTIAGAVGVTVSSAVGLSTRTQYSTIGLLQVSSNVWIVTGDLT